jgi:hypothetical protein
LHIAGSCGDLLSVPWIATNQFYSAVASHYILVSGRVSPTWNQDFLHQFPRQPKKHHYQRDWTTDLDTLSKIRRPWFINTSDPNQANLLKLYFKDQVYVISINYSDNLAPLVIKNFCTKVIDSKNLSIRDDLSEEFLQAVAKTEEEQEYFINLSKTQELGLWYAKQRLFSDDITYPPYNFNYQGDITIRLDTILSLDHLLPTIKNSMNTVGLKFDEEEFVKFYNQWRLYQDPIYFYKWANVEFNNALGYNPLSANKCNRAITLCPINQLLIKKCLNTQKIFQTTQELLEYLNG